MVPGANSNCDTTPVVAVLLAAGGSRRLGQPKQLLEWNGQPLWLHALEQLQAAGCAQVIVVLGAFADQCRASYDARAAIAMDRTCPVSLGYHPAWDRGQASSLRFGLQLAQCSIEQPCHILVALCDQPLLTATHYKQLIETVREEHRMVAAARYPEGGGVPACLHHRCLRLLRVSAANVGVRAWIRQQSAADVALFDFGEATSDVDTADQWMHLTRTSRAADVPPA